MTSPKPTPTTSVIVNRLIDAVTRYYIRIEDLPQDREADSYDIREVNLQIGNKQFRCLTDNEYGDMDRDNVPLRLNMILMELENYDHVDDFLEWARGYGMNAASKMANELWDRLQENATAIRAIVGTDLVAISSADWELYAGDARILRDLPPALARPDVREWEELIEERSNEYVAAQAENDDFDDQLLDELFDWVENNDLSEFPLDVLDKFKKRGGSMTAALRNVSVLMPYTEDEEEYDAELDEWVTTLSDMISGWGAEWLWQDAEYPVEVAIPEGFAEAYDDILLQWHYFSGVSFSRDAKKYRFRSEEDAALFRRLWL